MESVEVVVVRREVPTPSAMQSPGAWGQGGIRHLFLWAFSESVLCESVLCWFCAVGKVGGLNAVCGRSPDMQMCWVLYLERARLAPGCAQAGKRGDSHQLGCQDTWNLAQQFH